MTRRRAVVIARAVAWVVPLGVVLAGLHSLPLGSAPVDPLAGSSGDVATARFAVVVLRWAALGLGWYLLVVTLLSVALRVAQAPRAAARVEALAPAGVRRLLRGATAALATATSLAAGPVAVAGAATGGDAAVVMRRLPPEPAADEEAAGAGDAPVVMRRLPPPTSSNSADDGAASTAAGEDASVATREHVVQPGEHLWAVAEAALTASRGRPVGDAEIDPYWRLLVAENAPTLADPDLVFPGQKVRVPPVPDPAADV